MTSRSKSTLNLTVKLFGELQELCNNSSIQLQLPTPSCVGDLLLEVNKKFPILDGRSFRVAVNCDYVSNDFALADKLEIAFIPAVCGG